jgi:hypothetical protein
MIAATNSEMKNWLTAHEELRCDEMKLYFADAHTHSITIDLRVKEPHQLIYLARLIAHLACEEINFSHGYLWLTTWGVWAASEESIGFKTLDQFRRSYGENRSLDAAPGHYFRHDEFTESVCCLLQPMLMGWDAYYVPTWANGDLDYFVAVNHDSFVNIESRTPEMHDSCAKILNNHDWIKPLMK